MRHLTFGDLRIGVKNLLEEKGDLASKCIAFQIYRDPLKAKLGLFESLHASLSGKPLTMEIGRVDGIHDSSGRAAYYIRKAVEELSDMDESVRTAVIDIVDGIVPTLGLLTASYEDEASRAAKNRQILDEHAAVLDTFPVGPNHTLKSILSAHVEAGEQLNALLSNRADKTVEGQNARTREIIALRGATIGLLSRFRQAAADEVAHNPELPRDLESELFAYFDQMEANRAARASKSKAGEEEPEPEIQTV